jgi:hypothetical protein
MARKKQARPKRGGVDDDDGDFATTITDTTSDPNSQQEDGRYPLSFFVLHLLFKSSCQQYLFHTIWIWDLSGLRFGDFPLKKDKQKQPAGLFSCC